jgi:peptidoglycan/xylan/chitin deacetylase (PgdA/CDA1 family)
MICLTGDTHHDGLDTNEQLWLRERGDHKSEVEMSVDYVKLCEKHNVKCTLYITGRTLAEQWDQCKPIADSPLCEVAGHTFDALPRPRFSRLKAWLTGGVSTSHANSHGSYKSQYRDVKKMCDIARKRTGEPIVSWRSHGLVRDDNTNPILYDNGIRFISDELNWDKLHPERLPDGLINHPINVIMDHDHLYHVHRTEAYVATQRKDWPYKQDPTSESFDIAAWGDIVEQQVRKIDEAGGIATVLMHPCCMYSADGFKTFERLLKVFATMKTIFANECDQYVA